MQIKKAGGKIFGASLTAAEQKAMNMEIQRQLVEYDRKNELELDAIILWELHTQLGLGPKRLKKFFDGFSDALNALVNRYEMDISDDVWLCTHKLKEIGVDVEDWYRQKEFIELYWKFFSYCPAFFPGFYSFAQGDNHHVRIYRRSRVRKNDQFLSS